MPSDEPHGGGGESWLTKIRKRIFDFDLKADRDMLVG